MARRSDIERQIADLQAQLEGADTDDEVWIKDESGREVKVTGRRATSVLERFKDLWEQAGDDDAGDDDAGDDDAGGEDPKPKGGGYFSKRPRAKG